jgi:glycosyltransferase involved in cell wall biosynthesis
VNIVLVHRLGAGQFRHLARYLTDRGASVTVICEKLAEPVPGVRFLTHARVSTKSATMTTGHLAIADEYVQRAQRVAETLDRLQHHEGEPDVVLGHIGWGSMLFVKDVLRHTPALGYCEYYFQPKGGDIGFDPREPVATKELARARLRNMVQRATLDAIEAGLSPTEWQRSRYPSDVRARIAVCHEGVDLDLCRPDPAARFALPDGRSLAPGDPVVTYVARSLEPYRGFPQFIQAATRIARKRQDAIFVVAGDDTVSYGRMHPSGRSWREVVMKESGLDPSRIVFLGSIEHQALVRLFQVSAAHVYLTIPFVLSWSLIEAMACGCFIVCSGTAPVRELIADGRNGVLTDFWDPDSIAAAIIDGLSRPDRTRSLREGARATVEQDLGRRQCLERQASILGRLIAEH